ncbi:hypothetical protein QQF64_011848 [Cirrhinus molitorella]|uniref:Secreted protein n=1 Tax=Cirrhinus molitorella TaxID=172907 RepID=A0ABR3LTY6_9TELE
MESCRVFLILLQTLAERARRPSSSMRGEPSAPVLHLKTSMKLMRSIKMTPRGRSTSNRPSVAISLSLLASSEGLCLIKLLWKCFVPLRVVWYSPTGTPNLRA